jgi:hypothetical protein
MAGIKQFETADSIVKYNSDEGILYMIAKPHVEHEILETILRFETVKKWFPAGVKVPVLADATDIGPRSNEVRAYYASEDAAALIKAFGIVENNFATRMLGNMFIRIAKPQFPTKIFRNYDEAREWLSQFVDKKAMPSIVVVDELP